MAEIILTDGTACLVDDDVFAEHGRWHWRPDKDGYARRSTSRGQLSLHRIVAGARPGDIVDHINGNKRDNRRCNLRLVSKQINTLNGKLHVDNTSGYRGVTWSKSSKKWQAQLTAHGRSYYLGVFVDPIDAHEAYLDAVQRLVRNAALPAMQKVGAK